MAHLTNFSFEFFYKIFTEEASQPLLYHGVKKSKMTKNANQGRGSCLNEREKKNDSETYRHAPCQRDFLMSYSSVTRHQWLTLFSSRHECFTSDSGLIGTRLVSCVFFTSPMLRVHAHRVFMCISFFVSKIIKE